MFFDRKAIASTISEDFGLVADDAPSSLPTSLRDDHTALYYNHCIIQERPISVHNRADSFLNSHMSPDNFLIRSPCKGK